jgi:hypothetical protein
MLADETICLQLATRLLDSIEVSGTPRREELRREALAVRGLLAQLPSSSPGMQEALRDLNAVDWSCADVMTMRKALRAARAAVETNTPA